MSKKNTKGFTLLEVAIGLVVFGLLSIPFMRLLTIERQQAVLNETTQNLNIVRSALREYALNQGGYPLPARKDVAAGAPGYGSAVTLIDVVGCAGLPPTSGAVCSANGDREFNSDAPGSPGFRTDLNEQVFIGFIPFAELALPERYAYDGFGARLTYAVSASLVVDVLNGPPPLAFNEANGSIRLLQRDGTAHNGSTNGANEGIVHYALVSHGEDNRGAFFRTGVLMQPCNANNTQDTQNCNNNGIFNSNFFGGARYQSIGSPTDAEFYDDYINFAVSTTSDFWSREARTDDIFSRVTNILIGPPIAGVVDVPDAKVDVVGNVFVERLEANRLCDGAGCECYATDPDLDGDGIHATFNVGDLPPCTLFGPIPQGVFNSAVIAGSPIEGAVGSGILCGNDQPLIGITNSDEECGVNNSLQGFDIGECPVDADGVQRLFPVGTDADGKLRCERI